MSKNTFHSRAQALEDAFFRRVDQELIIRIQEQHRLTGDEDSLATASGLINHELLDELLAHEITPKTLLAFSLFPAVHVAWANGSIEPAEREALLKAAHQQGISDGSPAHQLLESWLKTKPTDELFSVWKDFIHAVRSTVSASAYRDLREAAMKRAHDIAEAAGGFLQILSVSANEKKALRELEAAFAFEANAKQPATNQQLT